MRNSVMSSRPSRPLPPTNGWMLWNCACSMAHCTRSGTAPRSCRNASHCESAWCSCAMGVGTYVAVASVAPGGPIQFCEVRNSPGVRACPTSPMSRRSCRARTKSRESGSSLRRCTPKRSVAMQAAHLAQVVARDAGARRADLVEQQVRQADLGALDARRAQRLLALERRVEQIRVGQLRADAGELAQGGVGPRQRENELARVGEPRRQWRRHEGSVPFGAADDLAGLGGVELARVHRASLPARLACSVGSLEL